MRLSDERRLEVVAHRPAGNRLLRAALVVCLLGAAQVLDAVVVEEGVLRGCTRPEHARRHVLDRLTRTAQTIPSSFRYYTDLTIDLSFLYFEFGFDC